MSERWKPEKGKGYWCILDTTPVQTMWVDSQYDIARWEAGNVFKTQDQALIASINIKTLLLSLHENYENLQENIQDMVTKTCQAMDKGKENVAKATCTFGNLPKLTAEVFNRPECPKWAKYAAMDKNGEAYFYDTKPEWELPSRTREQQTIWFTGKLNGIKHILGKFDPTDWQNSLIKRPVKENTLPDWCKVGEWVWDRRNGYGVITSIRADRAVCYIEFDGGAGDFVPDAFAELAPARLRPYNAEEMPDLPFEVTEKKSDFRTIVASCHGDKVWLADATTAISTEELKRDFTAKGTPCGVLEHLENGKWVE